MTEKDLTKRNRNFKDETGNVYGKLTVVELVGVVKKRSIWLCRCECGNMKEVAARHLRDGGTKSCGCGRMTQGGGWKTPEYTSWKSLQSRCYYKNGNEYHNYGERSIGVCKGWLGSFQKFLAEMGPRPSEEHSVDRIDNDGNYSCGTCPECVANGWPMNCRWATPLEQSWNSRKVKLLTHDGETLSVRGWGRKLGMSHCVILDRLKKGASIEEALTPSGGKMHMIEFNGKSQCIRDWAREIGIYHGTLEYRLKHGWSIEKALTHPVQQQTKPDSMSVNTKKADHSDDL